MIASMICAADGEHRVQRRHRLLKDHADVAAADRLHLPLGQPDQVLAEERDPARFDAAPLTTSSRMIESDVTLLPEPLSPTMPSVWPCSS